MQIGKDFLRTLTKYTALNGKLNLPMPLSFASKGKLPKKALSGAVMRAAIEPTNNIKQHKLEPFQDYIEHLKRNGTRHIKYIGKQIKKEIKTNKNIDFILKTVIDDYVTILQNYYTYTIENNTDSKIDKEYIFLDMIETSNSLLYGEEKKLLNYIVMGLNKNSLNNSLRNMSVNIYRHTVNNKKEEMRYICTTYHVCRQYPAFTDYLADLISEILKLSESKFEILLELIKTVLKSHEDLFATISQKEDRELMLAKLETFSDDMFAMKEFLAVMRSVITQRFKLVDSGNEKLKKKTKAVRLFIDIIDKALSIEEDIISVDFDITIQALRDWSGGTREVIGDIIKGFVNHVLGMLEHNLSDKTRKEISVLVEVITRDSITYAEIYEDLFKFGSNFEEDNDTDAKLEIV